MARGLKVFAAFAVCGTAHGFGAQGGNDVDDESGLTEGEQNARDFDAVAFDTPTSSMFTATDFIRHIDYPYPHTYKVSGTVEIASFYHSQTVSWDLDGIDKECGRKMNDPNKSPFGDEIAPYSCSITIHDGMCCDKGLYKTGACVAGVDPGPVTHGHDDGDHDHGGASGEVDPFARAGLTYEVMGAGKGTRHGKNPKQKGETVNEGGFGHLGWSRGEFTVTTGVHATDLAGKSVVVHGYGVEGPIACANIVLDQYGSENSE
jgi:hypothetical protein